MFEKSFTTLLSCVVVSSVIAADIHLAGDSTCASYPEKDAPHDRLGQKLSQFCKKDVKVYNRAICGYSTKTFIELGVWNKLLTAVKPGDFVMIQFGHNDQKSHNNKLYADVENVYPANLRKFIADVKEKGGIPVIVTSIVRCTFNAGKLCDANGLRSYCEAAANVARAENVSYLDLNRISMEKISSMGEAVARKMYMYSSGVPGSENDHTHLTNHGAETFAGWLVDEVKAKKLPLADCFK